ncbi:hypothetical protein WME76_37655 [Sorangium sp. So ce119]|uniref:hypothetical protein n=1 Tax=Sorangium sp. So ce119 TaxID=3133279 RepID=UPI003F61FC45
MGISIAYSGKLRDPALVPELVGDLAAKAESAGWLSKTMRELVAEKRVTCSGLEGITLYPHRECEPLHFHFDEEGTFINHYYHALLSNTEMADMMRQALAESAALTRNLARSSQSAPADAGRAGAPRIAVPALPEAPGVEFFKQGSRYNWTKTQFAGPKVHVAVCAILRYVKERYAPELEVKDDSGYFASGDYEKLEAELAYVERLAAITTDAVQAAAKAGKGPMTLDAFVNRINEELAEAKNKLH